MKKILMLTLTALVALTLISCGGNKKEVLPEEAVDNMEVLMKEKNKLMSKGMVAEIGVGKSQDMSVATNKAELDARAKMARSLETKLGSLQKNFTEEVGEELLQHFTEVNKSVTSRVLQSNTVVDTKFDKVDGKVQAYVLLVLDTKAFAEAYKHEMEANEVLKNRWRASKGYAELEKEVAEYEAWKAEQAAGMGQM